MKYYIIEERKKLRLIPENKIFVDGNTPLGEACDYYEIKPHGGRKSINRPIASIEINGKKVDISLDSFYYMEFDRFITFS